MSERANLGILPASWQDSAGFRWYCDTCQMLDNDILPEQESRAELAAHVATPEHGWRVQT